MSGAVGRVSPPRPESVAPRDPAGVPSRLPPGGARARNGAFGEMRIGMSDGVGAGVGIDNGTSVRDRKAQAPSRTSPLGDRQMVYLCYDLKGIQSFIFAVPRLRYICGGSALVARFDRESAPSLAAAPACRLLFAGGGKGAFACASRQDSDALRDKLIDTAHCDGLSISFGVNEDFSEASHVTDASFPWLPPAAELDGHPCAESGLYPTRDDVHRLVRGRDWQRGEHLSRHLEAEFLDGLADLADGRALEFFHDVSSDTDDGRAGHQALGGRNRWAIVAMDGNDLGAQHRAAGEKWGGDPERLAKWVGRMSAALDACTRGACGDAVRAVFTAWRDELRQGNQAGSSMVVPFRPLLVGGDDIVVLCHVNHALRFVKTACEAFCSRSRSAAEDARKDGIELWPGTGGELSITAGVLFAPLSLPLATAIPYAESLLASAKGRGRTHAGPGPSPACIDWESVTEGLLDTVAARRARELRFLDKDNGETVSLTRRPYTLDELAGLKDAMQSYREIPTTIRHQVLPSLRAGFWDRQVFLARLGKHSDHRALVSDLQESEEPAGKPKGRGWVRDHETRERQTNVLDALLLLEEDRRMSWSSD